jgi:hypothetical protein
MPIPIPARSTLSRRGKLIADALAAMRVGTLDQLARMTRVRPVRLRGVMRGEDWAESEIERVALIVSRAGVAQSDLVQP